MGTGQLELGNVCGVFNISKDVDIDLYKYIDIYQRKALEECKSYGGLDYIKMGMNDYLQTLLSTRIDNKVSNSCFNDYWVGIDDGSIKICWNLHTPQKQRLEYEYSLED